MNRLLATGCVAVVLSGTAGLGGAGLASASPSHHKSHHHKAKVPSIGAEDVTGTATAIRAPFYSHTGEDVEGEIPFATTELDTGAAMATSSIFWPGETGANGGSTLQVLGITQVPTSVSQELNDPEKAEAQSSVGKPVVTQSQPGVSETATAKAKYVAAEAEGSASALPQIGKDFGTTNANSVITVEKKAVVSSAHSSVHDLTIAKVLKIGAVTSTAEAVTSGKTASGTSNTVVSNATIAGIKVAITDSGIHVTQKSKKLPGGIGSIIGKLPTKKLPSLDTIVNKALKQSGINVHLTKATKKVHKSHVVLNSGALIIGLSNKNYKSQDNDTGNVLVVGGATLDAISSPGFPPPVIKPIAPIKTPGSAGTSGSGGTAGTPGTPGTAGTAVPGGGSSPDVAGNGSGGTSNAALAAASYTLFGGLKVWWMVLAALGAAFIAFGLRALPDRVLETPGAACRLEDA